MPKYTIYIVDDEQALARGIALGLPKEYIVKCFTSAEPALESWDEIPPDLVLLDIGLPGMSGIEALFEMKKKKPDVVVIMITAFEDVQTVISAMQHGAYDYVVKPIQMDSLELNIKNALDGIRLRKEVHELQEKYLKENMPFFIGESKAIQDVMHYIEKVAKSPDTPILILGESGTGKELIAKAIHFRSPHFQGPLIPVNCAAIPKDLLESELFGYEKGAFSGAHPGGKKGLIQLAEGGTLFLDEIGDLDQDAQAKLLRFLESGEFYKVGAPQKIQVQTRIIAATNKNLMAMIDEGSFREDLYYRIGVVTLEVPSLNQHSEDIVPIAKHFLMEFSQKFGKTFKGITSEAEQALQEYKWRGNVRELRNLIERAVLVANGPILSLKDLGIGTRSRDREDCDSADAPDPAILAKGVDLPLVMQSLEKKYIEAALKISNGNETNAARLLNINYSTLRYRRRKLNIP